jgi:hypothetical protein
MTDKEEFAARSQLKWTRKGDAWILLYRRRQMGCRSGSSREGGRLRARKHPLKTPAKKGSFSAEIVALSFKCGLGPRMADHAQSERSSSSLFADNATFSGYTSPVANSPSNT